jgi:hypothetical protein
MQMDLEMENGVIESLTLVLGVQGTPRHAKLDLPSISPFVPENDPANQLGLPVIYQPILGLRYVESAPQIMDSEVTSIP